MIRAGLAEIAEALDHLTTTLPGLSAADLPLIRQALSDARIARSSHPAACPFCSFGRKCAIYRRDQWIAGSYLRLLNTLPGPPEPSAPGSAAS